MMNSYMCPIPSLLCVKAIFFSFCVTLTLLTLLPMLSQCQDHTHFRIGLSTMPDPHWSIFCVCGIGTMSHDPVKWGFFAYSRGHCSGKPWVSTAIQVDSTLRHPSLVKWAICGALWKLHPSCARMVKIKATVLQIETPKLKSSISYLISDLGEFT